MFGRSFKAQNASVINIVACSCVILVDISGHQSLTSLFRSDFHCSTAPPASSYDIRHKLWDHTEAPRQMPPVDASRDLQEPVSQAATLASLTPAALASFVLLPKK